MQIELQIFPLLKILFFTSLLLGAGWSLYQKKIVASLILIAIFATLLLLNPLVLSSTSDQHNIQNNKSIQQNKVLPQKIEDHSFEEGNQYRGIEQENLK